MLSNITCYCRKCFNPHDTFYVEVRNNCIYYIYMSLEYSINDQLMKKYSPVFAPSTFQRLNFPSGASFTQLKVFNCAPVPPRLFNAKYVKNYMSTCHIVSGHSDATLVCAEVPC